jgi:broad-specificity NMP kinase
MGVRNYLIEGGSGVGKTAVGEELQRRGRHVVHGDRELKYRGDPGTGAPLDEPVHAGEADKAAWRHAHLLWDVAKVKALIADGAHEITFFCGGSRNHADFIELFDGVFVLDVADLETLFRRLDERVARDATDFGGTPEEKALVARLHATREGIPRGAIMIDARAPIDRVVDEIVSKC